MSDITDRIAAALYRAVGPKQIAWDEVSESSRQVFYGMAAAVVEELGLREEEGADFTFGGQTRYVTPWVDDVPLT